MSAIPVMRLAPNKWLVSGGQQTLSSYLSDGEDHEEKTIEDHRTTPPQEHLFSQIQQVCLEGTSLSLSDSQSVQQR